MAEDHLDQDEIEFRLWEEMKDFNVERLHLELTSSDDSRRVAAARQLHVRGGVKTFDYAIDLSRNDEPNHREIAAYILGQLGTPEYPFADLSRPVLLGLLDSDPDANVRSAAAAALGHLRSTEDVEQLERAAKDGDSGVRANVAFALGKIGGAHAVRVLLALTYDPDLEIVHWAVIGLRFQAEGVEDVRNRFVELLNCSSEDVIDEVIVGLSSWRDERVFPFLVNALRRHEINLDLLEAARQLGDKRLLPVLKELHDKWKDNPPEVLMASIASLEAL